MKNTYHRKVFSRLGRLAPFLLLLCAPRPVWAELQIPVENSLGYAVYFWLYSYPKDVFYGKTYLSYEATRDTANVMIDNGLQYVVAKDLANRETLFGTFNIDAIKHKVDSSNEPSRLRLTRVMTQETRTQSYAVTKMVPEQRTRTVKILRWRPEQRERTVRVFNPRTRRYEDRTETYSVRVQYYEEEERTYTICKSVQEMKEREYTVSVAKPTLQLIIGKNIEDLTPEKNESQ